MRLIFILPVLFIIPLSSFGQEKKIDSIDMSKVRILDWDTTMVYTHGYWYEAEHSEMGMINLFVDRSCSSKMIYSGFLNRIFERGVYKVSEIDNELDLRGTPSDYYFVGDTTGNTIKIYKEAPTLLINCDKNK